MSEPLRIGRNDGIVSTGDHAENTVSNTNIHLSQGGLRTADEVACSARVAELGPHTAGRLFVGREDELAELEVALAKGPGVITTGLGGVGKSTLAHRYAELHRHQYNPIWWIDAEDPDEIEAGLARLARRLYPDLALIPDPDAAAWGRAWLSSHGGWLVVLDNATDPAEVANLVGTAHEGRFVLTSRLTTGWEELAEPIQLSVLTQEQALDLLARAVTRKELLEGAELLCETLGFLPLAVRLAAAYLRENAVTASAYLQRLEHSGGELLAWTPTRGDSERTVARIWEVSLRKITDAHGALPHLLLLILAWFAPTDIPVALLHGMPGSSKSEVDEALGRLAAYALITRDADAVTVHRLVQAATRRTIARGLDAAQAVAHARKIAVYLLLRIAVSAFDDPSGWPLRRRLVIHMDAVGAPAEPQNDDEGMLALLYGEACFLREQGQVARSITLFERSVAGMTQLLGPDHPNTLTYRNNLADAYQQAGNLDRAIRLFEQNLADRERVLGPDDPNTLSSRHCLAYAYHSAGDLDQAIPLIEQTFADRERVLGPDHPNTLISRNNLAYAYDEAGDLAQAIPLHKQNLTDFERILGPDHPETLASRHNLAGACQSAGDLARAIPLHKQNLTDFERILGPDHPKTLTSRNCLASAFQEAGDLARATSLFEQTLADRERILGPEHPDTLISRNNLAGAYRSAGDLGRAIPLFERTLADRERVLSPDHPHTLTSRSNLASAYQAVGDPDRAIPLLEQTFADRERVLGPDHPDTLASRHNLASACQSARDLARAIPLLEQNLTDFERILGPDHPYALSSRNSLASAYQEAGDLARATSLFEQTLADRERILGPEHPDTLISRNNLAGAYRSAGDLGRAIPLYEQNLTESESILGPDHPNTHLFRRNLERTKLS